MLAQTRLMGQLGRNEIDICAVLVLQTSVETQLSVSAEAILQQYSDSYVQNARS